MLMDIKRSLVKMCIRLVLKADYIPRYGRVYRWLPEDEKFHKLWKYQYPGFWGLSLLDKYDQLDYALSLYYTNTQEDQNGMLQ